MKSLYGAILLAVLILASACNGGRNDLTMPQDELQDETLHEADICSSDESDAHKRSLEAPMSVILFLGNSLAAGSGIDPDLAFPSLIEERIDSLGWPFHVVNAGISGDTSADGLARLDDLLHHPISVLVLELGANDGLRGVAPSVTTRNLQAIIDRTRARHPDVRVLIAGMMLPPDVGEAHARRFGEIFPELAAENDADLVPFLLDGVGGIPAMNQPDGIHPTAAGQRIMTDNVWTHLRPILEELIKQ